MDILVDGCKAYAYTGGKPFDPGQPCVVLLHGALHDHSVWTLLARWLAHHGWSVLAVDQPGHGRSAGPLLPDIPTLADWVWALLSTLSVDRASLVGHSMGSLIALEAAARAPGRTDRLVMVGTAYPMRVGQSLLDAAVQDPGGGMALINALSFSSQAVKPGYPGPGSWAQGANLQLMTRIQGLAAAEQANVFLHDFNLCNAYSTGLASAEQVRCPVHFLLGSMDQMTPPKAATDLARRLNATVQTLSSGHALMQEQPDALLAALRVALA